MNPEKNNKRERFIKNLTIERSKTSQEGYSLAQDFFNKISTEYPGLGYPDREAMDPFNPGRIDRKTQRTAITYAARVSGAVVGVLTGEEIMGEKKERGQLIFRGQAFLVDPKFQQTNVAEQLITQIQSDYDNIVIAPVPLGGKPSYSQLHESSRSEALRRYYRRFGFEEHKRDNTMRWRKERNEGI